MENTDKVSDVKKAGNNSCIDRCVDNQEDFTDIQEFSTQIPDLAQHNFRFESLTSLEFPEADSRESIKRSNTNSLDIEELLTNPGDYSAAENTGATDFACFLHENTSVLTDDHQLMQLDATQNRNIAGTEQIANIMMDDMDIPCDVCSNAADNIIVFSATWCCLDCLENQCDECSRAHKRQKLFKLHQVVKIDEQMKKDLQEKQLSKKPKEIRIVCSVCAENNDEKNEDDAISKATLFCADCCESQCADCSKDHKKQRLFKTHKIVDIDSQLGEKLVKIKEMNISCDVCTSHADCSKEESVSAIYYCLNCKESQCTECSRAHKRQIQCQSHQIVTIDDKVKMKLLEQEIASIPEETKIFCDVCEANKEPGNSNNIPLATLHCADCCENQCSTCNKDHIRQRLFKTHIIIEISEQLKEKLAKIKQMIITCDVCATNFDGPVDKWSSKPAKFYCEDCEENQCEECNWTHKRQIICKGHQTIMITNSVKMKLFEKERTKSQAEEIRLHCDVCKANDESGQDTDLPIATWHCNNCCENQCDSCSREHKRQRISKDHQIVELSSELKEKLISMKITCEVCSANNDNGVTNLAEATQYCEDCQEKQCDQCSREHKRQKMCRNHSIVPLDKRISENPITSAQYSVAIKEKVTECDQCAENSGNNELVPLAVVYCIDCKEFQCRDCSNAHARQKPCREHTSIPVEKQLKLETKQFKPEEIDPCHSDKISGIFQEGHISPNNLNAGGNGQKWQQDYIYAQNILLSWPKLMPLLNDKEYSKIQQLLEKPNNGEDDLDNFWIHSLPYIIQRIKMWNGDVLTAQNLTSLINRSKTSKCLVDVTKQNPVSRLDCLTYIINVADFVVAQDILRILSKFPVAIPLIVQDISDPSKHVVTIPLIQNNCVIKWESAPGLIVENYLFSSPFRMVVAIRLGNSRTGKSTILNQLMRKQFLFSSGCEAGSRYGQPRTLNGSVEIVWLTTETCNDITWKTVLSDYYKGNSEEVAILANLHGDAFKYEDTLKFLLQFSGSFLVFLMPGFRRKHLAELKKYLCGKMSVFVLVDPEEKSYDPSLNKIHTSTLSSDDTQETMRSILYESLAVNCNFRSPFPIMSIHHEKSLRYFETLVTENSEKIAAIVRRNGCIKTRQLLRPKDFSEDEQWNPDLKELIKLFMTILQSSEQCTKQSLSYLETFFSQLSGKESVEIRAKVREANEKVRRIVKTPIKTPTHGVAEEKKDDFELKKAQKKLKAAMEKAENINLGQEHFFRIMGHLYEKSLTHSYLKTIFSITDLPSCFANLLINGHAIELFNGDSGEMQLVWMKSICDCVSQKLPNFKVFVISIIGLQSSGKSTLLNALFSCRFAVSVGRCSRGLFMRMILLNDELRKNCGCDCIILIDTEGLCSPEKLNDPKASQKDRLMATYAMGVSNLTIVNILGEGMTEMTEILQIAIVAMARLRGGGIRPDILMIQHLQERNVARIDQAKTQFCEAINKAFELINKNDIEIGSASAECLSELTTRIQSGDLFQHFGPFRDGSSVNSPPSETYHKDIVNLFETLLVRISASEKKRTFERWSNHFETYWTCVQEESFALNFKNVKHITDYLYFEKKIARVKELLERAIRRHRDILSAQIREEISSCIEDKRKEEVEAVKQKILDLIEQQLQLIPHSCSSNCEACKEFNSHNETLLQEISDTEWEENTKQSLKIYTDRLTEIARKVLKQTFDGSFIRQGCLSQFSDLIAKELKEALDQRPSGIYSCEEQSEIRNKIWEFLLAIAASKETGPDLKTKFVQALHREYTITGIHQNILRDFAEEVSYEHLCNADVVRPANWFRKMVARGNFSPMSKELKESLASNVSNLLTSIFQSRGNDYLKTGLDFEESMVAKIKALFPEEMKNFEKRFSVQLQDNFKIILQIFVLQQFMKKMENFQTIWNKQNKPTEILLEKKEEYMTEIETRLKSGFTCAGEGEVVAMKLCKALHKTAIQTVYEKNVEAIKSLEWTTSSEKVRLVYFEQLALEVDSGTKDRALKHFENPKLSIEEWYKNKVDSFRSQTELMKTYVDAITSEFTCVQNKVLRSATKKEIDNILQEHMRNIEDQYYSKLDPKDDDFEAFRGSIDRHLKSYFEIEKNRWVSFPYVSDDPEVKNRLGCTEHCYWCGAICWGARDHQVEKDKNPEMECHHSCHQPSGLKGTHYRDSKKLSSTSCHNRTDNTLVCFKEFLEGDGIPWRDAKQNHFPDWKFDRHCITTFDELMRWFFQKLHQDIAKLHGLQPSEFKELRVNGCSSLRLDDILKVVRSKI